MSRARRLAALLALLLAVAGCLTTHDVLTDRQWRLIEVSGGAPVAEAGLRLDTGGAFTIETGCNTGGGTYHLDSNRIVLDSERLTERACDGPTGAQELAILAVIEAGPVYAIDTGTGRLRITAASGDVLLFEAP